MEPWEGQDVDCETVVVDTRVHHTPVRASWLNQVESFFSILTRKVLRRGEFDSRTELGQRMLAFIEHRTTTATPFKWVYDDQRAP